MTKHLQNQINPFYEKWGKGRPCKKKLEKRAKADKWEEYRRGSNLLNEKSNR